MTLNRQADLEPANSQGKEQLKQPLEVINISGALLQIKTVAALAGRSTGAVYKDAAAGRLHLTKRGARCTRVTSENARAYLQLLAQEAS